jgi:hypothetical protein
MNSFKSSSFPSLVAMGVVAYITTLGCYQFALSVTLVLFDTLFR